MIPRISPFATTRHGIARLLPAACLLLCCAAPRLQSQDTKLRYNYDAATPCRYKMVEKQKGMTQSRMGMTAEINRSVESYFTVTAQDKGDDYIVLLFVQDTAIAEDFSVRGAGPNAPDYSNALTKKPVRLTLSRAGEARSAVPLVPLRQSNYPPALTDNLLARKALVLPALPARAIRTGMSWTESSSDTSMPSQTLESAGTGKGLRLASSTTTFTVEGIEKVHGYSCWKIRWKGHSLLESKMLFPATELFSEEEVTSSGILHFATAEGLLVQLTVSTVKESTRVVYGKESELSPSSTTLETTIQLLPPR